MKRFLYLLLLPLLISCGTTPIAPIEGESMAALKTEKVAVNFFLVEKMVLYREELPRVIYIETRSSSRDFSGVWDADRDISGYIADSMKEKGLNAASVYDVLAAEKVSSANQQFLDDLKKKFHDMARPLVLFNHKTFNKEDVFSAVPDDPEHRALYAALKEQGYRYLFELTSPFLSAVSAGLMGYVTISLPVRGRVIDLQRDRIIWLSEKVELNGYPFSGGIKKLEGDDMEKAKESINKGVKIRNFPALLGLSGDGAQ
jgi:hypothetical protein